MHISPAAHRYATALFLAAEDVKATQLLENQAHTLLAALKDSALEAVTSPTLGRTQRIKLVQMVVKTLKPHALLEGTLGLLTQKGRLNLLPEILTDFTAQTAAGAGIVPVEVETATPLTESQVLQIKMQIKAATSARDVTLTQTLRPRLIGGFRAFYQGKVWDASVSGGLEALKQRLRSTLSAHQKPMF